MQRVAVVSATTVALSGVGLATTSVPASAHTGDLKVTAVCNPETGNYDLTAKQITSSVPSNVTGATKWRIGTSSFQGTPSSDSGMDKGPVSSTGSTTFTLGSWSLPGTTTGYGPWVYSYTKWSNGNKKGSDGQLTTKLKGDCKKDTQPNPPKQDINCTGIYRDFGRALKNGDHINVTIERQNGTQYQVNVYVDRNITGGYDTLGFRYSDGTTRPLTEEEVKKGRIWLDLSAKVSDKYYKVQFVQINESENWPKLECGTIETIPVPAKPSQNDPCGPNNATWNVPADTDKIDWTLRSDGHLIAETKNGLKFADGTSSKDFGKAVDSGEPCKVAIPAKPSHEDPCGPNNATWNVPADTATLDWTLSGDGVLTVAAKAGNVFTDGTSSKNFGKAPDSGVKCVVPVPPAPSQNDPCGPNNATWNKPADTADYAWALRSDGHLVVTVKGDKTFPDGSTTKDYGLPTDSNEPCKVPVPAKPSMNDPCGPNNATWNKPADTTSVMWELESDGDLVASAKPGNVFADGTSSKNFGKAIDSNTPCPDEEIPVPAAPQQLDPCGLNNASWVVPADTDKIDWTLKSNGHLVAVPKQGYVFTDGSKLKDFGLPTDSNDLCKIPVPVQPTQLDPCGPDNASWNVPADTADVDWNLSDGVLTATALKGQVFDNGQTVINYGVVKDSGVPCPLTEAVATAPSGDDRCEPSSGPTKDSFTVPSDVEFQYSLDGGLVAPGTYPANGTLVVLKAIAKPGFTLADGAQDTWRLTFTKEPCFTPKKVRGAVKKIDKCETNNFYNLKKVKGLHYVVNGKVVREGVWLKTKSSTLKVKVVADSPKYQLVGKKKFVVKYKNKRSCAKPPTEAPPTGG